MSFWHGLAKRIGSSLVGVLILGFVIALVSQFVSSANKIMVYSFIIAQIVSLSVISIFYISRS